LSEIGSSRDADFEILTKVREESLIATQSAYGPAKQDEVVSKFTVSRDGREIISSHGTQESTLQLSITWLLGHGAARLEVGSLRGAADAAAAERWWQGAVEFDKPLQILISRSSSPN
jgi:hypothetical protein